MNKNEILQVCLKELALNRSKAQNIAYLNLLKAKKSVSFINIDKQEREVVFKIGKNKAFNIKDDVLEEELKSLQNKKRAILATLNLSLEDLQPQYSCPFCQDTGYVKSQICTCLKNKIHEQILLNSGASKKELSSFASFSENVASTEEHKLILLKLKKKFQDLAESFPSDCPKIVVLSGKTGVGKTFLSECFASEIINKGHIVSFVSAFGMNNLFTNYHTTFDDNKTTYLNTLLDPDVLIIDDLGTEPILRNITKEYLYLILSERSRLNKMTVVTTNLEPLELMSRYNERIFSRLFNKKESFLAQIKGNDIRIR